MKSKNRFVLLFVVCLFVCSTVSSPAFSQESLVTAGLVSGISGSSSVSPEEKLHALESTRFHFITLKQFHSGLFSQNKKSNNITEFEAHILNMALNKFLTSAGRETLLLEALRQNKPIRLRFSVPQKTGEYEMIQHPSKPLVYRFEPEVKEVKASIEIRPVLDQPVAFQITFEKGNEKYLYYVDWAGQMNRSVA